MAKRRLPSKKTALARQGMTEADARAYLARWEVVNAHTAGERRAMTPQQKFDELARLMEWAKQFGWNNAEPRDDSEVWARWNKLREAYRG